MRNPRWRRLLLALGFALIFAVVFAAYLRPAFMLDLATRISLCF